MKKVMMTTAALMMAAPMALAGTVDSSKVTTFQAGTAAVAAEVNSTISALVSAINDNAERLAALETAAPDSSVAGQSYQLRSINSSIAVGGTTTTEDGRAHRFANVTNGSLNATLNFGNGGTATFTVAAGNDAEYEINLPDNQLRTDGSAGETQTVTYTQSGNTVVVKFPEDGTTFDVEFLVSGDGSMLVSGNKEYDESASFNDNSTGKFAFVELIVGTRTANPQ